MRRSDLPGYSRVGIEELMENPRSWKLFVRLGHVGDEAKLEYRIRQAGRNVQGPFGLAKVQRWVAEGKVHLDMEYSIDGETWRPGDEVFELFGAPDEVPVRVKSFSVLREKALSGPAWVRAEHGGLVFVPFVEGVLAEMDVGGESIFDLRMEEDRLAFEADLADKRFHFRLTTSGDPGELRAILDRLPPELRQPRCRDCHSRISAETGACSECGLDFARSYRRKAIGHLTRGVGSFLLCIAGVVMMEVYRIKGAVPTLSILFGWAGTMAFFSLGILPLAIGPRFRHLAATGRGYLLIIATAIACGGALIGLIALLGRLFG